MSGERWIADVMPFYGRYGEGIPLWLVLGWISVESGGRYASNTTSVFAAGERGYFQLSPAESADLGLSHDAVVADPESSFRAGIALIRQNYERAQAYGFHGDDGLRMAKLIHGIGIGSVSVIMNAWPRGSTYAELADWARAHDAELNRAIFARYGSYHSPAKWFDNVDRVETTGRMLAGGGSNADTGALVVSALVGIAVAVFA